MADNGRQRETRDKPKKKSRINPMEWITVRDINMNSRLHTDSVQNEQMQKLQMLCAYMD